MLRRLTCCAIALLAAACAKPDTNAAARDTTATPPPPPAIRLADVAGDWQVRVNNEAGDSLLSYRLHATADTTGWTLTFPGRAQPEAVHVTSVAGDSVVTEMGPYASALRRGVQVRTRNVFRMQNGELHGRTVAHYSVRTADSVVNLNSIGRKVTP